MPPVHDGVKSFRMSSVYFDGLKRSIRGVSQLCIATSAVTITAFSRTCLISLNNPCSRSLPVALSMQQQLLSRPTSSTAARLGPHQPARTSAALRLPHTAFLGRGCAQRPLVHRQPTLQGRSGARGVRGRRGDLQASASSSTASGVHIC